MSSEQTRFSFDIHKAGWKKSGRGKVYLVPKSELKPCICQGYALAKLEQRIKRLEKELKP